MDTGSPEALFSAGEYVRIIQKRQGTQIACLEEIALLNEWISIENLREAEQYKDNSPYSQYVRELMSSGLNEEPLINGQDK